MSLQQRHLPKRPIRICLFGTSANPPTGNKGHMGVIQALVELQKFDEVRILPVYRHTFSSKRNQLLSFDQRVTMCELAVESLSSLGESPSIQAGMNTKVVVSRAEESSFLRILASSPAKTEEEKCALRVGTADLLEMFMETENGEKDDDTPRTKTEFSFCLGADTFMDLTDWKWKRSKDVLRLLEGRLLVVNRKQETTTGGESNNNLRAIDKSSLESLRKRIDDINATPLANGNIALLDVPSLDDVSSSKIRNAKDKSLVKHMLSPKVLDYVNANNLYGFGKSKEEDSIIG